MTSSLKSDGYFIHSDIIPADRLPLLREEADVIAQSASSTCVRHLRSKSPLIDKLAHSQLLKNILPDDLIPVRSILFDKTVEQNWAVAWHQDLTIAVTAKNDIEGYHPWSTKDNYPHVQPPIALLENMITVRIHLDDTPISNGALRVIPGSHLLGKIPSDTITPEVKDNYITCACNAGDILLMKPLILHSSSKANPPQRRRIIHIEYARSSDLHHRLEWAESPTLYQA